MNMINCCGTKYYIVDLAYFSVEYEGLLYYKAVVISEYGQGGWAYWRIREDDEIIDPRESICSWGEPDFVISFDTN